MKKEIRHLISQLKKGELFVYEVPEEFESDFELIKAERKLGLRRIVRCGYDVINEYFFVEEEINQGEDNWETKQPEYFADFFHYSDFIEWKIYDKSCYYQLSPEKLPSTIDLEHFYAKKSFIDYTIDDYHLIPTDDELSKYHEKEKDKIKIKKWITKFNECNTYQQLQKMRHNYNKSHLNVNICFFIWNYIMSAIDNYDHFKAVMEFISSGNFLSFLFRDALCAIFNPDDVVENYRLKIGSYNTVRKYIRQLKQVAEKIKNNKYTYSKRVYFDISTHFYCVETTAFEDENKKESFKYNEYYENIYDLVDRLKSNLSNCNLSDAYNIDYDFSQCIIDETTRLPFYIEKEYQYIVTKLYHQNKFIVTQAWKDEKGCLVKEYKHIFDYFFDFVAFLKGDLTNADLITCDGLRNLKSLNELNLSNALLSSFVCKEFKIPFVKYDFSAPIETSFDIAANNEAETVLTLQSERELAGQDNTDLVSDYTYQNMFRKPIYYISDIHLFHLLKNKKCETKSDIIRILRHLANTLISESQSNSIILINGDTSLDFSIFKIFVKELKTYERTFIFTIGNHDMWSCPDDTFEQLTQKYRTFLKENGMYLLQNDILYFENYGSHPKRITEYELTALSETELRNHVRSAWMILFGGTGFAGYNQFYNALYGLYRHNKSIGCNRDIEIKETQKCEALYKKVCRSLFGQNVVIMTHMPLSHWYKPAWQCSVNNYSMIQAKNNNQNGKQESEYGIGSVIQPGFVYVSGHTHRNFFYDDLKIRIYADNQFGYNNSNPAAWPHLKFFEIEAKYEYFYDYNDGIYEISSEQYKQFYRGKNLQLDFSRDINVLFMLKKKGYYCFIHQSKIGSLSIMNGGALKRLENEDINYYYNNMESVVSLIKNPLEEYTAYQEKIAKQIREIGGTGRIHGCIVDIDFYNHIFVNPTDGTIVAYWASDIIYKLIYPTVLALLEEQCPILFAEYKRKMLEYEKKNQTIPLVQENTQISMNHDINLDTDIFHASWQAQHELKPVLYLETDIYRASRQIKKMQKLNSNILSTWPDEPYNQKTLKPNNNLLY